MTQSSSVLGERDESANKKLASKVAESTDQDAIAELVDLLTNGKGTLRTDAAKTLGEIASRQPSLLVPHAVAIGAQVESSKGAMYWESLTVLNGIATEAPDVVIPFEEAVGSAISRESAIARDRAVSILVQLADAAGRCNALKPVLLDILRTSPVNQLPTYAEQVCRVVRSDDIDSVTAILERRLSDIDQPAKVKRIQRSLRSMDGR